MAMKTGWGHVLTAMVTPMYDDGRVNFDETVALAKHLVKHGSTGLVVSGTTGESPTLSNDEKIALFKTVKSAIGDSVPMVCGTSSYNTAESVEMTREAVKAGADGILAVAPYYNRPDQEGVYQHFQAIAQACSLPVVVYNIPGRCGINVDVQTMCRLAELPNIAAIKEASGNLTQIMDVCAQLGSSLDVYSGDDAATLPMMSMGGAGIISVVSHIAGDELSAMCQAFADKDVLKAQQLHNRLLPLVKAMFCTSNPVPTKYALNVLGHHVGGTRLPLVGPNEACQQKILTAMRSFGLSV